MTALVSLDEAKLWLRVMHDEEDTTIGLLIGAASEAVLEMADGWTPGAPAPERLRLAVLARVAIAFDNREKVTGADGEAQLIGPLRMLEV
jgi:hypothetical protein